MSTYPLFPLTPPSPPEWGCTLLYRYPRLHAPYPHMGHDYDYLWPSPGGACACVPTPGPSPPNVHEWPITLCRGPVWFSDVSPTLTPGLLLVPAPQPGLWLADGPPLVTPGHCGYLSPQPWAPIGPSNDPHQYSVFVPSDSIVTARGPTVRLSSARNSHIFSAGSSAMASSWHNTLAPGLLWSNNLTIHPRL